MHLTVPLAQAVSTSCWQSRCCVIFWRLGLPCRQNASIAGGRRYRFLRRPKSGSTAVRARVPALCIMTLQCVCTCVGAFACRSLAVAHPHLPLRTIAGNRRENDHAVIRRRWAAMRTRPKSQRWPGCWLMLLAAGRGARCSMSWSLASRLA